MLVHEHAPDEIAPLELRTKTSNLEIEGAVIFQELVDAPETISVVLDANVLEHLEGCDLVEAAGCHIPSHEIMQHDLSVLACDNVLFGIFLLICRQCDSCGIGTVFCGHVLDETAPPTADIKKLVTRLQTN